MKEKFKNYLTTKNILLLILVWIILVFIDSAGNGWLFKPEEYFKDWKMYFILDSVVLMTCFSFKSLIDKNFRRVSLLSGIALINLTIVYFLVFNLKVDTSIIPFFHPITLSIPIIFLIDKKFKFAIIGYIICYALSFGPFLISVIPILFAQLWFDSLETPISENRFARFIARFFIYALVSTFTFFLVYLFMNDNLIYPNVSMSKSHEIIMNGLALIAIYYVLNQYLRLYYEKYGNWTLKTLSYLPIIWIIPLFEILINEKKINKTEQ